MAHTEKNVFIKSASLTVLRIICLNLIRPYFYMNLLFYLMFLVAVTGYILLLNSEVQSQDGAESGGKSQEIPELTLDGVRDQPSVLTSGKNAI